MWTRLRGDDAWRSLLVWPLVGALNLSVLMGVVILGAMRHRTPIADGTIVILGWIGIALYLGFGRERARCTVFDLGLPIPAPRLWLAHVTGVALAGTLLAAASSAAVAVHAHVVRDRVSLTVEPLQLAALLVGGLLLALALLEVPAPTLHRVPRKRGTMVWTLAVLVVVPASLVVAGRFGPAGALLPAALAALIAWRVHRALPMAFALAPRAAEPAQAGKRPVATSAPATIDSRAQAAAEVEPVTAATDATRARRVVRRTLVRCTMAGSKDLLLYAFTFILGAVVGGVLGISNPDRDLDSLRYIYISMATYILFVGVGPRLALLHHLDPLPIERRKLCSVLLLPSFLVLCLGYGAAAVGGAWFAGPVELVDLPTIDGVPRVVAPSRVCEIAWDGRVPETVAPWGEPHAPTPRPLFRGSRAQVYSPYSTPPGSSPRYIAWQISRAVAAVYGESISPEEIANRYLASALRRDDAAQGAVLTLRADFPELRPRFAGPLLPTILLFVGLPWLLLVALLLRAYRPGVPGWVRPTILWGFVALVLLLWVGQAVVTIAGWLRPESIGAAMEIGMAKLGDTALGVAGIWVACAVALAAGYRLARSQFQRMEIPVRPARYSLIEWARDES